MQLLILQSEAHVGLHFYCFYSGLGSFYSLASERSERDTLRSVQLKIGDIYIIVRAISVYSAGVPYAARFTSAVKIPLPLATFQF